jgi:putative spermidine/putrescine transport system permease protein
MIILFFLIPVILMLTLSFYRFEPGRLFIPEFTLENYAKFLLDPFYSIVIFNTLRMALIVTVLCLTLGYPVAYFISRIKRGRGMFTILVIAPWMVSSLVHTFGWMIILGRNGIINNFLLSINIIQEPIRLLYTFNGVYIAMTHALLPIMILSIISVLGSVDYSLIEAARSLGAGRIRAFFTVTFPLSIPGVFTGSILVLSLCIAWFVTPALIGGIETRVLATTVFDQTMSLLNWPFGSTVAAITIIISMFILLIITKIVRRQYRGVFG